MASGIGVFVGLVFAGVVLAVSLVAAIFFPPWWAADGYAIAIYVLFAVMAGSSWCIQVRKNDAWGELNQLEQYVLHRHRAFFYFPFGASNFGTLLQLDAYIRRAVGDLLRVEGLVLARWSAGILLRCVDADDYDMDANSELPSMRTAGTAVGAGATACDTAYP